MSLTEEEICDTMSQGAENLQIHGETNYLWFRDNSKGY